MHLFEDKAGSPLSRYFVYATGTTGAKVGFCMWVVRMGLYPL